MSDFWIEKVEALEKQLSEKEARIKELETDFKRVTDQNRYVFMGNQITRLSALLDEAKEVLKRQADEWDDFIKLDNGHVCESKVRIQAMSQRAKSLLQKLEGENHG